MNRWSAWELSDGNLFLKATFKKNTKINFLHSIMHVCILQRVFVYVPSPYIIMDRTATACVTTAQETGIGLESTVEVFLICMS